MFGTRLKELREYMQLPQRQIASVIDVDTATYCKIEKGDRKAKKMQVIVLADFFNVGKEELISLWLADKITDVAMQEKECANNALALAGEFISKNE